VPDKVDRLQRIPLFSRCSRRELQFLATRMDQLEIPPGKTLITEGQLTDTFYILLAGEVDILQKGRRRRRLAAGDFFGEIGMLDRGPATATVVTASPVDVLILSHPQFRDAIRANAAIALKVMATMAERLRGDTL